jgi:hypothetical protein
LTQIERIEFLFRKFALINIMKIKIEEDITQKRQQDRRSRSEQCHWHVRVFVRDDRK